jgi:phasin family protein
MSKTAYETSLQWADINKRTIDRLFQQQIAYFEASMENGLGAAQRAMQAKDYNDLMAIQAETAQEMAKSAVEQTRKTIEVLTATREAMTELFQQSLEKTTKDLNETAAKK